MTARRSDHQLTSPAAWSGDTLVSSRFERQVTTGSGDTTDNPVAQMTENGMT
jgi:hypothetical protein